MIQADPRELLARFWRDLADLRTGMLGLATEHEGHAQPMTAHFEGEHGPLWFYAHAHSRIVMAAESGHPAVFHYVGRKHDLYACIHGEVARAAADDATVGRFWSEEVARWYPNGRHDPELALLCFTPSSAQIWLPSDGAKPSLFGFGRDREAPHEIRAEIRL